ncbi:ribonuclease H-like domain-containing protein, partial [Tanacetum coccineum]
PHKGVQASASSDVMYSFTSAQDGDPLQDDVRLCLGDDLKKAQDHSQRQAIYHIKEKLKAARDLQKSYVNYWRKPLEFEGRDCVLLKVPPWKGVVCFGKKGEYRDDKKDVRKSGLRDPRHCLRWRIAKVDLLVCEVGLKVRVMGLFIGAGVKESDGFLRKRDEQLVVIENGNSFKPAAQTTTNAEGTSTTLIPGPVTADEKIQKKNDVKARSMLLMALPNEHLLTFNQYKDAKTLFAAIQTRFGGNDATKKTQKTLLKQIQLAILGENISQEDLNLKFLRSLPSEWNTHVVVWRNKPDLDTMSFDDLYNNFKIVEQEVKGTASSSSSSSLSSQNVAFVSSSSSTNEVNTAYGVSTANTQVSPASTQVSTASTQVSTANLSDATVYAFLANQPNGSQLVHEDLEQIHEDDLEEMDLKWQLAYLDHIIKMDSRRNGFEVAVSITEYESKKVSPENCFMADGVPTILLLWLSQTQEAYLNPHLIDLSKLSLEEFQHPEIGGSLQLPLREGLVYGNKLYKGNNNYLLKGFPKLSRNMTTKAVLLKIGLKPLNTARPVNIAHPKTIVYSARPMSCFSKLAQSTVKRPYQSRTTLTNKNFNQKVNTAKEKVYTAKPKAVNTARPTSAVVNAVRANQGHSQKEDQGYVDSGCSRHMTGNMSYLSDFKEFDRGYVTFGGGTRGGRITGKGTLKTGLEESNGACYTSKETKFSQDYIVMPLEYGILQFDSSSKISLDDEQQTILVMQEKKNVKVATHEATYADLFGDESEMGFMVYQMDVKSSFLYGTIEEEVYVCQPPRFEDPDYPDKVYKVVKAMYSFLIKLQEPGLKVKQREDGIFINQDKYVAELLWEVGLSQISMIGSLMYLTSSRPYIMFAIGNHKQEVVSFWVQLISCSARSKSTPLFEAEYVAAASCYVGKYLDSELNVDYGYNIMTP